MPLKIESSASSRTADGILVVGVEGIGKSTFAKDARTPLFADADNGLAELGVPAVKIGSYGDVLSFIHEFPVLEYKTAVLDTADRVDVLMQAHLCQTYKWTQGIESPGYGKGWQSLYELWDEFLDKLTDLRAKGVEVIMVSHAKVGTFKNPDGSDFSVYMPNIKEPIAAKIKAWASCVFFLNHDMDVEIASKKTDVNARGKAVSSGTRVMYTIKRPQRDAKNRYSLPEVMPLSYAAFDKERTKFWAKVTAKTAVAAPVAPPAVEPVAPLVQAVVPVTEATVTVDVTTPASPVQAAAPVAPAVKEHVHTQAVMPPVPALSVQQVGALLGAWQKDHGQLDVAATKEKFIIANGIKRLAEGTPETLAKIVKDIHASYVAAQKAIPAPLAEAVTHAA